MLDALFDGYCLGLFQRLNGSGGYILHLEAWKEAAEMQRILCKTVICNPAAHLTNHRHVIVNSRNNKVRQFNPYTCCFHGQDGIEDWL